MTSIDDICLNIFLPISVSSSSFLGSGSTYIYGYCDSTWKPGMSREETLEFVKNALSLAMRRDGSSGGTIRMACIDESGVERHFVPGVSIKIRQEKLAPFSRALSPLKSSF